MRSVTEQDSKVLAFVGGRVIVEAREKDPESKEVEAPSSSMFQLVESNLGFAEMQGHIRPDGRRTRVELVADAGSGAVTIDMNIEIPVGVRYSITSNHGEFPGFEGLTFARSDGGPIVEMCGRLKPGEYRISGKHEMSIRKRDCRPFEWVLELDRPFDLPPDPTPGTAVKRQGTVGRR